jgi:hypothetical protein
MCVSLMIATRMLSGLSRERKDVCLGFPTTRVVAAGERVVNAVAVEASVPREQQAAVVTAFARHEGEILLVRRDVAGMPSDRWDGVTRSVGADHRRDGAAACRTALRTLVGVEQPTLVREGDPVTNDGGTIVRPFLFDVQSRVLTPDESIREVDWIAPPELRQRATVPGLWRAYRQVEPTVETVVGDTEHGSRCERSRSCAIGRRWPTTGQPSMTSLASCDLAIPTWPRWRIDSIVP